MMNRAIISARMDLRGSEDNDHFGINIPYATTMNTGYLYEDENVII